MAHPTASPSLRRPGWVLGGLLASLVWAVGAPFPGSSDQEPGRQQPGRQQSGAQQPAAPDVGTQPAARDDGESGTFAGLDRASLEQADKAAERGLRWLAERQTGRGAWLGHVGHKQGGDYLLLKIGTPREVQASVGSGHVGVTALAGMAFLAGGHLPGRGDFGDVVGRTSDYLAACVQESGLITDNGTRMYSHAFATLFLAEAYGIEPDPTIKAALERSVFLITDCQNPHGAWRYNPFTTASDLSVTVCQLQALRAARNIGIQVPAETIEKAMAYVLASRTTRGRNRGLFYYKIRGRGAYRKNTEYAINAAALTALASAGTYDRELYTPVLDFLDGDYEWLASRASRHYFYWYGNYYAVQGFYQAGGQRFVSFYRRLVRDLLTMQQPDGRWINNVGPGDEFSTAVACILLQLPKQYLPIFQR